MVMKWFHLFIKCFTDAESGTKDKSTNLDQPITLQPVPMDRKMTFKSISGLLINLFTYIRHDIYLH
jgi:hypothetical protein